MKLKAPVSTKPFAQYGLESGNYYVVHPGMGGSALNWPTGLYIDLITQLSTHTTVVITGTAQDANYLSPLKSHFLSEPNPVWLDGKVSTTELLQVLGSAKAVIAPSTGVLHLAASTGVKTIGLFSPVRVQSIQRWGPLGEKAEALAPSVDCPGDLHCIGQACPHFNCMYRITVGKVLQQLALN